MVIDGEYYCFWWYIDFLENLNGIEGYVLEKVYVFKGVKVCFYNICCCGKVFWNLNYLFIEYFKKFNVIVDGCVVVKFIILSLN